jgi:hypothetical protein
MANRPENLIRKIEEEEFILTAIFVFEILVLHMFLYTKINRSE